MKQKVGAPAIIVAVIVVLGVGFLLYKQFAAPSPTNTGPHTYPSWIDPATGKPKAGGGGSTGPATGGSAGTSGMPGGSGGNMPGSAGR
jgi:hypothetical protein